MNDFSTTTIHQALHGYRDGHRLLQSSIKLSVESERIILPLSDLSGPTITKGFENYLTGYPLIADNFYAIAKTWYAEEMPRPGSVWTHTLFIPLNEIHKIENLSDIIALFNRPLDKKDFSIYKTPLSLTVPISSSRISNLDYIAQNVEINTTENRAFSVAAEFLLTIYEQENHIILFCDDSTSFEFFAISLWNQRWSTLRSTFKFCTGSLTNRKLSSEVFDFQIVPFKVATKLKREDRSATFFDFGAIECGDAAKWALLASKDLFSFKVTEFRKFLWNFGPRITEYKPNQVFIRLCQVFETIHNTNNTKEVVLNIIKILSSLFPAQNEANELKMALLNSQLLSDFFPHLNISESFLLNDLVKTTHHRAFNVPSLNIKERSANLFQNNKNESIKIAKSIFSRKLTPIGRDFIAGLAANLTVIDVINITGRNFELAFELLKLNPILALNSEIWELNISKLKLLDFIIQHVPLTDNILQTIFSRILDEKEFELIDEIYNLIGNKAVFLILEWYDRSKTPYTDIPFVIKSILRNNPEKILEWVVSHQVKIETLLFASFFLNPDSKYVINSPIQPWLGLAKSIDNLAEYDRIEAMTFILALGFNNPHQKGDELIKDAFQLIHETLRVDGLDYENWRLLTHHAPTLDWFWEWDKCKRLRVALIKHFIDFNWSLQIFLDSIKDEKTWYQILDDRREVKHGKKFFRIIADQVLNRKLTATKFQKDSLLNLIK